MATKKEKATDKLGFKAAVGVAALVGLIGGLLFGVWDSITVILDHAPPPVAFGEIFFLALYSVALYGLVGCLGMAVIGVLSGGVISAGKYAVNKSRLAGAFIGVFVLLAVFALFGYSIMRGNIIDIVEGTVIGIISGVGLGGLGVYVLGRGIIRKEKLIAGSISVLISLLVFLYGGLWVNLGLLSGEAFSRPTSLLANIALLLVVIFLGIGLYALFRLIWRRHASWRIRQAGYIFLGVIICAFIAVSFIGPFNFEDTPEAGASAANEIEAVAGSSNLGEKPNILWIVMDAVRADHLSCYGCHRNTTPNIDRVASEGILFENAISAAPWTLPSHASMFTGMFPSKHGTDAEHQWLDDEFQTIAEVLNSYGYQTVGYSNNTYVSPKCNMIQGFDEFEVTSMGKEYRGKELVDNLRINYAKRVVQNNFIMDDGAHSTNKVVKRWIADAHQSGAPFFVFINYMEAHDPYHPPKAYAMPYLGEGVSLAQAMSVNQDEYAYITGKVPMSEEDFEILLALYDGEISYLDFRMGQLFDYLRELEILDDTVLIITADHGELFGEHHLMEHQFCVYDTLIHVPLVIRYPELFDAGLRVSEQVQLTDIYPTIFDILAIDQGDKDQVRGVSLLEGREEDNSFAIGEYRTMTWLLDALTKRDPQFDVSKYSRRLKTVRTEEFKYIWASDGRDELYNIRQDPEELNNLIETKPEKARELNALLKEWLNSFGPYRPGTAQQLR